MADFTNPNDPNAITWQRFTRYLDVAGRSPRTRQSYTESAQLLADHAKNTDLLTLTKPDIESWIVDVRRQFSVGTAQVRFRSVRAFYGWAVREEWIDESPMKGMRLPNGERKLIPVPDTGDLRKLLAVCSGKDFESLRDSALLRLMADCGLRLSEAAGLTPADINLLTDHVTVLGKGSVFRKVGYSDATAKAVAWYLKERDKHQLAHLHGLWLGSRGQALTTSGITQMLRRRCKQAGIRQLHPHQLRHWSASEHLHKGLSGEDAMERYGWVSVSMLRVYARDTAARRASEHARQLAIGDSL